MSGVQFLHEAPSLSAFSVSEGVALAPFLCFYVALCSKLSRVRVESNLTGRWDSTLLPTMFASSCVSKKDIGARQLNEKTEGKLVERLKRTMWDLCKWGRETFPGSQPISFGRRNLRDVTQRPYVIGEKSDGERHMLITDNESRGVYLVDRRFNFYRIEL
ncbi:hypothetical protein FOZ63_033263 [Perkinsus olseni]|uniref:mRNA capping enzyme adenylation domain-containing protein n=1 Tax=Perkinsus olseni TaxID=32597 RepID=A0A7J6QWJ1_PEROL|nr:hypothetical protein FOZ63_033263 [Perkinsus olseni]